MWLKQINKRFGIDPAVVVKFFYWTDINYAETKTGKPACKRLFSSICE
jgi:hypothetical protein